MATTIATAFTKASAPPSEVTMEPSKTSDMPQQAPPPYSDVPPAYGFQVPPPDNPPPPQQVVFVSQPTTRTVVITPVLGLGPTPLNTQCPQCHQSISTRVTQDIATRAHLSALILCLIGCWFCFCLPYCMDCCKNTNHYCPECDAFLGTFVG